MNAAFLPSSSPLARERILRAGTSSPGQVRLIDMVSAVSSVLTPFALGAVGLPMSADARKDPDALRIEWGNG